MEWIEYKVLTAREFGDAVAELFHDLGSGGAALEDEAPVNASAGARVWVKAYFPASDDKNEELTRRLRELERAQGVSWRLFSHRISNEDWEHTWKAFFHSFRVGERLVIRPSWETGADSAADAVVCIDPDMAFGTGQHATTRFCLEQLEQYLIPGSRVLDAGCGSGILAIAAAQLGAGAVLGIDNDELAVRIARDNVALNRAAERVVIRAGDLYDLGAEAEPGFDLILANLTDAMLTAVAEGMYSAMAPGGRLIVAGINYQRWAPLRRLLLDLGLELLREARDGEWIGAVWAKV